MSWSTTLVIGTIVTVLLNVISVDAECIGGTRATCRQSTCSCGTEMCEFTPTNLDRVNPTIAPFKRGVAEHAPRLIEGECNCPSVPEKPCMQDTTTLTRPSTVQTPSPTTTTLDVLDTTTQTRRVITQAPSPSTTEVIGTTGSLNTVASSVVGPSSTSPSPVVTTSVTAKTTTRSGPKMERIDMWNLTSDELASGVVALSSGHVKCSGRIGANKMYKVNNTATLELAFSPPRRLMRVELAEFSATDSGEVIASSSAKRATMKVMINFAETDVSKQIQSAYASYRFAGIDMSDFSVSAVELLPTSSDSLATDRPTSNSLAPTDAEDGGFPWWAIVIIVIGALVFAAGIGLVAFRSFKQRSGSADNKEDAPPAGRRSESSGSTELGELQTVARDLRASTVSSTSTAANYQSLQEVDQYGGLHLKDDDAPDTDLDEKSSAGTVVAKVGQYQKADISAGPGHHYDKIHPNVFNQ